MLVINRKRYICVLNIFIHHTRLLCSRNKNFDYFRKKLDYKNLLVEIENDSKKQKFLPSSEFSLKKQSFYNGDFFYDLMQRENVMKLSSSQVKDILCSLASVNVDSSKYALALKFLDEKCALSAEKLPLDLSFYILDAWFLIYGMKTFKKHYYSAITSQWSRKVKKCSKSNLILVLYFIGLSKQAQPFLMESVIDRMENIIDDFSDEEIALACLSFFKCSKRVQSTIFLERACISAHNLFGKHDKFNTISILKCLRLSKYFKSELLETVKNYCIQEAITFNLVECTNFLALFATQNIYHKMLFESLEMQAFSVLSRELKNDVCVKNFNAHPSLRTRVKDVARLMWSAIAVGHTLQEKTLKCVTEFVERRLKLGEYESQLYILIDTLQSFVLANHYPQDIFTSALTVSTFKAISNSDRAKPKYQYFFVEKSLAIEHPEIPIYSSNFVNPIPKHLEKEVKERKGFQNLLTFLDKNFPKTCKSCYLMPHVMIAGIFFSKPTSSSNSMHMYEKYVSRGILSKEILEMLRRGNDYFCIEILDPSVCTNEMDQPSGLMKTKLRHLKKLNLEVCVLSSNDINNIIQNNLTQVSCKSNSFIRYLSLNLH